MKLLFWLIAISLLAPLAADGQIDPTDQRGPIPYAASDLHNIDRVDLTTGNLVLRIPLVSYKQRGALPDLGFFVFYGGATWNIVNIDPGGTNRQQWFAVSNRNNQFETYGPVVTQTPNYYASSIIYPLVPDSDGGPNLDARYGVVVDENGVYHVTGTPDYTNPNYSVSLDGTGLADVNNGQEVIDRNGIRYGVGCENSDSCPAAYATDPSGNQIVANFQSGLLTGFTDSIGRQIPFPLLNLGVTTINFPGPHGPQPYTFAASMHDLTTDFPNVTGFSEGQADQSEVLLDSITLPDGGQWSFTYDTWGDPVQIALPTGGSISYEYSTFVCPSCPTNRFKRIVMQRTVSDGQTSQVWNYSYGASPQGFQQTVVTDPAGNDTVHIGLPYETETDYFAGAYSASSYSGQCAPYPSAPGLMKSVLTGYDPTGETTYDASLTAKIPRAYTTVWPDGEVSETVLQHDFVSTWEDGNSLLPDPQLPLVAVPFTHGDVTEQDEYGASSCSPGNLLRTTTVDYKWMDDANGDYIHGGPYLQAGLLGLASSETVAGVGGGSSTRYGYDENNGSPQGVYGNRTSAGRWLNTTGQWLTSGLVYNSQGMPTSAIDPKGNQTTTTYQCSGSLPATVTNALGQVTQYGYDCNSGLMTSVQDPNDAANGIPGTLYSYDGMGRLTLIDSAKGARDPEGNSAERLTAISYPSATEVDMAQDRAATGDGALRSGTFSDGLGRAVKTIGPDGSIVRTAYDGLGQVCAVSNRTFTDPGPLSCGTGSNTAGSAPTDGYTYFRYDALGRKTVQTEADGNQEYWFYNGSVTDFFDANWYEWEFTNDALGRLAKVRENDPYGSGALNLETDYTYNALDSLTSVDQIGVPPEQPRMRSFVYDSLSRLTSATNPESGTTGYQYASADGSLCSGDPSNACGRTDARGIVTSYTYDALNRPTGRSYANDAQNTAAVSIVYDASSEPPVGNENNYIGRVTEMTSRLGTNILVNWETGDYDQRGNDLGYDCLGESNVNCVQEITAAYSYNLDGTVQTYAAGAFSSQALGNPVAVVTYGYDNAGRVNSIVPRIYLDASGNNAASTVFSSPTYSAIGGLASAQLAIDPVTQFAGITLARSYDNRLRIAGETDAGNGGQPLYSYSVAYYANGTVSGFSDSVMGAWQSWPDHVNRLLSGTATDGPYSGLHYQYIYDSFGNPTQRAFWGTSTPPPPPSESPTYNANNQLVGLQYDADGNLTNDGLNQYLYDAEGRVCAVENDLTLAAIGYMYDGKGNRVSKGTIASFSCDFTQNGYTMTSVYTPGLEGEQLQEDDGSYNLLHTNIFLEGKVLASYAGAGLAQTNWHYSLNDWLGTRRVQANFSGAPEIDFQTMPFGDGGTSNAAATEHEFTGKERDAESGNDYFGARYYNSNVGRFMSPDPLGGHLENPQSLNKYVYALNNPLTNTDPTGLDSYLQCTSTADNASTCQSQTVGYDKNGNAQMATVQGVTGQNGQFTAAQIGNDANGNLVDKTTGTGMYTASVNGSGVQFSNNGGQSSSTGVFVNGTPQTTFQDAGFANGGALSGFNFTLTNSKMEANQTEAGYFSFGGTPDQAGQALQRAGFSPVPGENAGQNEYRSLGTFLTGANSGHFNVDEINIRPWLSVPQAQGDMHFGEHNISNPVGFVLHCIEDRAGLCQ